MDASAILNSKSKFLKKEDVEHEPIWTIRGLVEENVAPDGTPHEVQWVLNFAETEKGLILSNKVNTESLITFFGRKDVDTKWIGRQVQLYVDPNVMYQGKRVGGIRLREPKRPAPAQPVLRGNGPAPRNFGARDINSELNEMADDIPM